MVCSDRNFQLSACRYRRGRGPRSGVYTPARLLDGCQGWHCRGQPCRCRYSDHRASLRRNILYPLAWDCSLNAVREWAESASFDTPLCAARLVGKSVAPVARCLLSARNADYSEYLFGLRSGAGLTSCTASTLYVWICTRNMRCR